MKQPGLARGIFKGFVVLAMLGVLGIAALLGSLWLERRTEIALPTPTGPFAVGRAIYDWTDDTKLDTLAPVPGTKRELLVWIWYPSAAGQSAAMTDDYVPAPLRAEIKRARSGLFSLLTRDLSKVHAHSLRNADVSLQERSYPVVIMRAGASAEVWNYSTLAEDLASRGYVVVGFDAPYRDRKSTRLNSSHSQISYAVFCLKKKKNKVVSNYTRLMHSSYRYTSMRLVHR